MARVKTTAIVSDIRGKLNGSVFQGNNGILSLRQYKVPCNRRTSAQEYQRNVMDSVQRAWRALSSSEQLIWDSYAAGLRKSSRNTATVFVSGHALFLKLNSYRLMCGYAVFTAPQACGNSWTNVDWEVSNSSGSLLIVSSACVNPASTYYIIELSGAILPTQNFNSGLSRYIAVDWNVNSFFDVSESYIAAFGTVPAIGQTIWVKSTPIDAVSGLPGITTVRKVVVGDGSGDYEDFSSQFYNLFSINRRIGSYAGCAIRVFEQSAPGVTYDIPFAHGGGIDWDYYDTIAVTGTWYVSRVFNQANGTDLVFGAGSVYPGIFSHNIRVGYQAYATLVQSQLLGDNPFVVWFANTASVTSPNVYLCNAISASEFLACDADGNLVFNSYGGGDINVESFFYGGGRLCVFRNSASNLVRVYDESGLWDSQTQNFGAWNNNYFGVCDAGNTFDFDELGITNGDLTDGQITALLGLFSV